MSGMGMALMGTGVAEGEHRAIEAAQRAISSPLLEDASIHGARGVLINVTGGEDMTLHEVSEAAKHRPGGGRPGCEHHLRHGDRPRAPGRGQGDRDRHGLRREAGARRPIAREMAVVESPPSAPAAPNESHAHAEQRRPERYFRRGASEPLEFDATRRRLHAELRQDEGRPGRPGVPAQADGLTQWRTADETPAAEARRRILVIDDDPETGRLVRTWYAGTPYEVEEAKDGAMGIEAARCDPARPDPARPAHAGDRRVQRRAARSSRTGRRAAPL